MGSRERKEGHIREILKRKIIARTWRLVDQHRDEGEARRRAIFLVFD